PRQGGHADPVWLLCAPIRRISKRADQQRNVDMLTGLAQFEDHLHLWKKRLDVAVVGGRIEREAVHTGRDLNPGSPLRQSALVVSMARGHPNPVALSVNREHHRDAGRWLARGSVENVRGNHVGMSLLRRISVIFRCSSAAICNSSAGSW